MLDVRLDGGRVVRPRELSPQPESIGIAGERIAMVGDLREVPARKVVDIGGTYVLPGIIDTHVHIGHTDVRREFLTESQLAGAGGVTCLLVYFRDPEPYDANLREFIGLGTSQSCVDFAVHLAILHDQHLEELDHCREVFGITSFKMYTTYKHGEVAGFRGQDDGLILDAFRRFARTPGAVISVHCENDDIVERGKQRWMDPASSLVAQWSQARPPIAEVEAIQRMALLAREAGCVLYIPHVSSGRGVTAASAELARGTLGYVETCAHYLGAGMLQDAGTLAKVNPPVRCEADADVLWEALSGGRIHTVGTDHCAIRRSTKIDHDLLGARLGFPGLGTLLPVLLDGVSRGRADLSAIAVLQRNAAKVFHLAGKGLIAPGYDADLAVVDLTLNRTVPPCSYEGTGDFSPFERARLTGWPVLTLRRGEIIARDGRTIAGAGSGRYLYRAARPSGSTAEPSGQTAQGAGGAR
jgi:dihydroorotase-like cyclic amidohydrolase